jgi:hypothetical protein
MALSKVIGSGIGVAASIAGEGTATTSLQQGLAKQWSNYAGSGTTFRDSFNTASATDNGTGQYTITLTNDKSTSN